MRQLQPTATLNTTGPEQISRNLSTCLPVFVRVDSVRESRQPPYDGPFCVIKCWDRYLVIDRKRHHDSISVDRLKVAYVEPASVADPAIVPFTLTPSEPFHLPQSTPPSPLMELQP
ncbi:unnamed protein product [Fasciola hepatica]|uniref:Uncharacterized protein n=1 Tax=Fasciola hepatica TaxID=6192 RepID=A0ABC9HJ40_FASHE|nr:unnamed protein product [Fasciola hepatica]